MERKIITTHNFETFISENFKPFETAISECSEAAYQAAFSCDSARKLKNIVYLYKVSKKIPRLIGESDILYIGQTSTSFQARYARFASKISALQRNKKVHQHYGEIYISACAFEVLDSTLISAENRLLWHYYCNHAEYPPFNYTKAFRPALD
ncbi:hypothetical protein [Comamonas aquatica]|jgi:hypothetical protein|uniref:Uncharacterized protein n=1 Tax=Comamonas aquatica TaxID=225991 RepID=A0AA42L7E1_9BURK|nr:hypothetical protein [Comamonas aquatica]MDH0364069.1 hypothetical protein [Comamonas aquatica]MDH1767494.1 hypothetical protein [Comamonas aquatica]